MEIILKFDGIEEISEAKTALNAMNWKLCLYELDQTLRSHLKHGISFIEKGKDMTSEEDKVLETIRETIRDYMESYSIKFD